MIGAPPRICANAPCNNSLEGMRVDAKWCSGACEKQAKRSASQARDEVERFMGRLPRRRTPWRGRRADKARTEQARRELNRLKARNQHRDNKGRFQ